MKFQEYVFNHYNSNMISVMSKHSIKCATQNQVSQLQHHRKVERGNAMIISRSSGHSLGARRCIWRPQAGTQALWCCSAGWAPTPTRWTTLACHLSAKPQQARALGLRDQGQRTHAMSGAEFINNFAMGKSDAVSCQSFIGHRKSLAHPLCRPGAGTLSLETRE